eukprot:4370488-Pyramimonas_sp.AAC.1
MHALVAAPPTRDASREDSERSSQKVNVDAGAPLADSIESSRASRTSSANQERNLDWNGHAQKLRSRAPGSATRIS